MAPLALSDAHREDLAVLAELDGGVVQQFSKLAVQFLTSGEQAKVYGSAARTLSRWLSVVLFFFFFFFFFRCVYGTVCRLCVAFFCCGLNNSF